MTYAVGGIQQVGAGCFDVTGMDAAKRALEAAGFPFTVDSGGSFAMERAAGRFGYVEDPDGTLVEPVETHRVPVLKRLGWSLDLRGRPPVPLPDWMLRALGFTGCWRGRKGDDVDEPDEDDED